MVWPFSKFEVSVVPMRGEHVEFAADLHARSFSHGWSPDEIIQLLNGGACVGHVALQARSLKPVGFVLSQFAADEAEILTIAVDADTRNRGVGRSLLRHHAPVLASKGVTSIFLEVDQSNKAALKLYQLFDFKEVGRRPGYYRKSDGTTATALIMRVLLS